MEIFQFKGMPVATGISTFTQARDGSVTFYSSVEFVEDSGRTVLIESVMMMGEVDRFFELGDRCEIFLATMGNAKIAFGIKKADGLVAYEPCSKINYSLAFRGISAGIIALMSIIGAPLSIPLFLYGVYHLIKAPMDESARRTAFYGSDPKIAREIVSAELVSI